MAKRKAYRKPEIKQVELAPEEVVLTACKLGIGEGRTQTCDASPGACVNVDAGS